MRVQEFRRDRPDSVGLFGRMGPPAAKPEGQRLAGGQGMSAAAENATAKHWETASFPKPSERLQDSVAFRRIPFRNSVRCTHPLCR